VAVKTLEAAAALLITCVSTSLANATQNIFVIFADTSSSSSSFTTMHLTVRLYKFIRPALGDSNEPPTALRQNLAGPDISLQTGGCRCNLCTTRRSASSVMHRHYRPPSIVAGSSSSLPRISCCHCSSICNTGTI
jgi:hypothetical protein